MAIVNIFGGILPAGPSVSSTFTTSRRSLAVAVGYVLIVAGLVALVPLIDLARSAGFVARVAGRDAGALGVLARASAGPFEESELRVPSRHGVVRARLYRPRRPVERTVVLTAGVHALGIDEPRVVALAREVARSGLAVVTPELSDLIKYQITPRLPDVIEDVAIWTSRDRGLAPDGRVALVGVSFSGGLSIIAAGRESLRHRVGFTFSFGGHGDLGRTLRYLCTGAYPGASVPPPHDYGAAIILMNVADEVVPASQADGLRHAVSEFLLAAHYSMFDEAKARAQLDRAAAFAATLPEPSRTIAKYVETRDIGRLGPVLLPAVERFPWSEALSPEHNPPPEGPVYLMHGAGDTVIPTVETDRLTAWLRARGVTVRTLVTTLITHADVDRGADPREALKLAWFWSRMLAD